MSVGDTVWVTIPGELQSSLGEAIKAEARRSFARGFVAGASNDYLGYFVTATLTRGPATSRAARRTAQRLAIC